MKEGNFFVFNSIEEMIEMRELPWESKKWEYIEGPMKPGTLISPKLHKHWKERINECRGYKYIFAFNRFNGDSSYYYTHSWPHIINASHLVINDATDKIFAYPSYMEYCDQYPGKGTYLKKNLGMTNEDYLVWNRKPNRSDWPRAYPQNPIAGISNANDYEAMFQRGKEKGWLKPGPESPVAGNIKTVLDCGIEWVPWKDRRYFAFFAGQTRSGYRVGNKTKGINDLIHAGLDMGWKLGKDFIVVDKSVNLSAIIYRDFGIRCRDNREAYMRVIANSRFCYNFSIGKLRNRREWEILLGGGLLLQDKRTEDMERDILIERQHFLWIDGPKIDIQLEQMANAPQEPFEKIAWTGYHLAKNCWLNIPTIEFRLFFLATQTRQRVRNYFELIELEQQYFGGPLV